MTTIKTVRLIVNDGWTLTTEQGEPVHYGQEFSSNNGLTANMNGGRPPHGPGKSGYVWTEGGAEYYPSVFGLRWVSPEGRYFGDGKE